MIGMHLHHEAMMSLANLRHGRVRHQAQHLEGFFAGHDAAARRPIGALGGLACLAGVLAIYRHKSNIQRLLAGTESKIGQKKKEAK